MRGRTQFRAVGVTARTKKCLKGITCVRFTPKMRVYTLNCVTPAQRNFLPRRLHASPLQGFFELGEGLEEVCDQAVVGDLEDRGFLVLVDSDYDLGILHACEVLNGS